MKKRNAKRNVQFLAAAALTAVLITGQTGILPAQADGGAVQMSSLIPDNVTVEEPAPLSEISLPSSDYGTLSWADDSSVPSKRVQSYEVVFRPYNTADLAKIPGWDGQSDVIYSSVTVVVSSISEDSSEEDYGEGEYSEEETGSEYDGCEDENYDGTEVKDPEAENQGESTETDVTGTPEAAEGAEITGTPAAEEIAELTGTPAAETPDTEEGAEAEAARTEAKTTEETGTEDTSETADLTGTPDITETPETASEETSETEAGAAEEQTPTVTAAPESDEENIFDGEEKQISEDTRPDTAEEDLTVEEQEARAAENHTCSGISVSGINLPWYVQFRVTSGEDYQFTNEAEAGVFKSYEFELWDLKNNTEYQIPDGEYISVTVPVKAGYDYTIEHLLDSGAVETIVPSVDGSTMVFSTHSFSPFGIAGSKSLIDNKVEDNTYVTPTPASASSNTSGSTSAVVTSSVTSAAVTPAADGSSTASADTSSGTSSSASSESQTDQSAQEDQSDATDTVNTGDNTPILPFVILGIAAVVIIAVIIYLRKRKN